MAKVDDSLEDEGYVRWVQTGTCLGFVKKALEEFASQRSQVLQQRVKNMAIGTASYNALCYDAEVEKKKIRGKWTMKCNVDPTRQCADCQLYLDELDSLCVAPFRLSLKHFENSNLHVWHVDNMHWNMAKVYMHPSRDVANLYNSPQDTDLSNILNFIEHCSVANCAINDKQNLQEVRNCRNSIMHSSTFTVTQQELADYTTHMIHLLEDQTSLLYINDAKEESMKIKEVQKSDFVITTDAEFRVLRDRALELQQQNASITTAVEDLQKECEELEEKDDENSKTNLSELVKEIEEKEASLKELEATFQKLQSFATRKKDLNEKMKTHTATTKSLLNTTKQRLYDMRNKYNRALTQPEKDSLEEIIDQYQTDEEKHEALTKLLIENMDYQGQIEELEKMNKDAAAKHKDMETKIDALTVEKDTLKAETDSVSAYNLQLQEKVDKTEKELEKYKNILDDKETELAGLKFDIQILENKITNLKGQIEILKEEKEFITNIEAKLQKTIDKLKQELEANRKDASGRDAELRNLNTKLKLISVENNELKSNIKSMEANKIGLEKEQADATAEFNSLLLAINEIIEVKHRNKFTIIELRRNEKQMKTEISQLGDELKEHKLTIDCDKQTINRLEHIETHLRSENKQLKQRVDQKHKKVAKLKAENRKTQSDNEMLAKQVQTAEVLINRFKADIDGVAELKKENDRLRLIDSSLFRIWCCAIMLHIILNCCMLLANSFS